MDKKLTGLIAAPHTPLRADGSINFGVIAQQAQALVEGRVTAAFVCGTTGEGLSLTTAERQQVVEHWVKAAPPELKVIVHAGHTSIADAKALAAHAQQAGAYAVSILAPCFFKPGSVADLVSFCAEVAAEAPKLPFYYYHLPSMTGVLLSMVEFLQQAQGRIPTLAGIKYTHIDLMEYQQCLRFEGGRYDILFGRDEILLSALALGARGAIGSTYNYAAPLYNKIIAAYQAGDLKTAADLQMESVKLVEVLKKYGELPTAKAIMTMMGVDCGGVRPPLRNLAPGQYEAIRKDLAALDIFTRKLK